MFENRIREIRKTKGVSLRELAVSTGLSHSHLSRLETGTRNISMHNLHVIAQCLKVPTFELLRSSQTTYLYGKSGNQGEIFPLEDEFIAPAPRVLREFFAVLVDEDSMFPVFEKGNIIYYTQHENPKSLLNRRVVVQLKDHRKFIRILRSGAHEKVWTLTSVNGRDPDIVDIELDWVAPIIWVRYSL